MDYEAQDLVAVSSRLEPSRDMQTFSPRVCRPDAGSLRESSNLGSRSPFRPTVRKSGQVRLSTPQVGWYTCPTMWTEAVSVLAGFRRLHWLTYPASSAKWAASYTRTKTQTKEMLMYYVPDFLTGINSELSRM